MDDPFILPEDVGRDAAIRLAADVLARAGVEAPVREARLLLIAAAQISPATLIADGAAALTQSEHARFVTFVGQRCARVPFARITGRQEFYGLDFELDEATLIPRADTESLVDLVLDEARQRGLASQRILDLGTGTGAILGALLHELPAATGIGVDLAPAAVASARANLARIAPGRADLRIGDWFAGLEGRFGIIVSNPPYIPAADIAGLAPEVSGGDPLLALDGGRDGLDCYRRIAAEAGAFVAPDGMIALEIGAGQEKDVARIFKDSSFLLAATRRDLAGHVRALAFVPAA